MQLAGSPVPIPVTLISYILGIKLHYDNFQNHMEAVKEGVSKVTQAASSSVSDRLLGNTKKLFDQLKSLSAHVEKVENIILCNVEISGKFQGNFSKFGELERILESSQDLD
jgi:hypothetical protein